MLTHADLYDQDLYAWTQEQAALLQAGCFDRLDIPHLVEELGYPCKAGQCRIGQVL
jgi:hypothetical protein